MDLLEEYIKSGRIKLNTHKYHETYTVHDPCTPVLKKFRVNGSILLIKKCLTHIQAGSSDTWIPFILTVRPLR